MEKPRSAGWADYIVAFLVLILLALSMGRILYKESLLKESEAKVEVKKNG